MSGSARVRAAAAALTLGIIVSLAGPAGPAAAADDEGPAFTVAVTQLNPGVMTSRDTLTVGISITNTSANASARTTAELRITREPLAATEGAIAWLAGEEEAPAATRVVREVRVRGSRGIPPDTSSSVSFNAPRSRLGVKRGTTGVFGLEVRVVSSTGVRTERTLLPWYDTEVAAQPMVVIGTIAGTETRARALLTAAASNAVTIAADPTVLTDEAGVFTPLSRDAYLLPAGHLDVASLVSADQRDLIERAVAASRLAFDGEAEWIAVVPAVDGRVESAARALGAGALMVDARQAVPGQPAIGLTPRGTVVVHPQRELSLAVADADPADPAATSAVLGLSLLGALETDSAPVVVAPGARWRVAGEAGSPVVAALLIAPWTAPTQLTPALETWELGEAEVLDTAPVGESIPTGVISQASSALAGARLTAAASTDPVGVAGPAEAALLRALSYDGRLTTDERAASIDAAVDALYEVRNALFITGVSDVNLVSSSGELPVTVRNDLPADVTVAVAASSDSPNLDIDGAPTVEVPAGGQVQVLVPVNAISSADVHVQLWLENDSGQPLTAPTEIHVRVRAQWGDTFTWVVAGGFVLLLTAGVIRTLRRGRGDTREPPTPELATPDELQAENS